MNLIDADALFKDLFIINGKVFPNIDIDNFPTTMEIKNIKKTIKKSADNRCTTDCTRTLD